MIFWFWALVILVNYFLAESYLDLEMYRFIANLIFLLIFIVQKQLEVMTKLISIGIFRNYFMTKKYLENMDTLAKKDNFEKDEDWYYWTYWFHMDWFYDPRSRFDLSKEFPQEETELGYYDENLGMWWKSAKKWIKSWIFISNTIQHGILFILILSCIA